MQREIHGINHLGSVCLLQVSFPSRANESFHVFWDFPSMGKVLLYSRAVGQEQHPVLLVAGSDVGGNKGEKYIAVRSDGKLNMFSQCFLFEILLGLQHPTSKHPTPAPLHVHGRIFLPIFEMKDVALSRMTELLLLCCFQNTLKFLR